MIRNWTIIGVSDVMRSLPAPRMNLTRSTRMNVVDLLSRLSKDAKLASYSGHARLETSVRAFFQSGIFVGVRIGKRRRRRRGGAGERHTGCSRYCEYV